MLPLQVPSLPAPIRRTPSPVIPGAWPSDSPTNASGKTSTSSLPAGFEEQAMSTSSSSQNPLHLDHVLNFQQKLSRSLSKPARIPNDARSVSLSPRSNGLVTTGSIPSDDSDLTRFTRNDTSTSLSGLGDTSVSTAYTYTYNSTPERLITSKLPMYAHDSSQLSIVSENTDDAEPAVENSIYTPTTELDMPPHISTVQRPRSIVPNSRLSSSSPPQSPASLSLSATGSPAPSSLCPTFPPSINSATGSIAPSSPIMFASPTSSQRPFTTSEPGNSSYQDSGSPSWETSYGSEFNTQDITRMNLRVSPHESPSPRRPMPIGRLHEIVLGPEISVPGLLLHQEEPSEPGTRSPSMDLDAIPMLTALSLPGTPGTGLSMNVASPRLSPILAPAADDGGTPWTLSLSPVSFTASVSTSPSLDPTPVSVALSPTSSFARDLGLGAEGHVVTFPSVVPSGLPSPMIRPEHPIEAQHQESAAEYAAAIMSSAWGSEEDRPAAAGVSVTMPGERHVQASSDMRRPVDTTVENTNHLGHQANRARPSRAVIGVRVLGKFKRLGGQLHKLLSRKLKGGNSGRRVGLNVDIDVDVQRGGHSVELPPLNSAAIRLTNEPVEAPSVSVVALDGISGDRHTPPLLVAPGLGARARKPRPSLTPQTYASTRIDSGLSDAQASSAAPPIIRVFSPSASSPSRFQTPPEISAMTAAREKPLPPRPEQVVPKSKRRLSLSALSGFARSSSVSPPIVTRPRPRSTISFTPLNRTQSSSAEYRFRQLEDLELYHPHVSMTGIASDNTSPASPPGLTFPSRCSISRPRANENIVPAAPPSFVPSEPVPKLGETKKSHRFSLSAISNFATNRASASSGANRGSWAGRPQSLRIPNDV